MDDMKKKVKTPSKVKLRRAKRSSATQSHPSPTTQGSKSGFAWQDDLVEKALVSGDRRDLLETYFGEELYEELRVLTMRARTARVRGGPRVLLLPGIMGSKLGQEGFIFDDVTWVDPMEIVAGKLASLSLLDGNRNIVPLGVILVTYLKLKLRLKLAGFDADFYPYDWRQDIADLGDKLARQIVDETKSKRSGLYLVGHSMGGLVSRAAVKKLEATGEDNKVRRLIMLGTPNYGSFSPVQAFSGYSSTVKKVAALDLRNSEEGLVNTVFNTFPGLHQMLPARQKYSGLNLYEIENWPETGVAPRPTLLQSAPELHEHLAAGRDSFTLIAGINRETIVDVRRDGDEFVFSMSRNGDATVPLAFAEIEDVATYYIDEEHGSLPNNGKVIKSVIEILETGQTQVLPTSWTPQRRADSWEVRGHELVQKPFDGRRGEQVSPSEARHLLDDFAAPPKMQGEEQTPAIIPTMGLSGQPIVVGRRRQQRIDLRLACGSVSQVDSRVLVLGLFKGVNPSGAARAIDDQLDGVITEFVERRLISASVGEVFVMPANRYRMGAELVIFAGLGTYDDFNEEVLRLAAENIARTLVRTKVDEFATVLLSSGTGMAIGDVLSNLIEGFLRGLSEGSQRGRLRGITLCEIDQQRFEQMHNELLRLTTTTLFDKIEATVEVLELPPPPTAVAVPSRRELNGADPVYLIVREMPNPLPEETNPAADAPFTLRASVLTAGAKATVVTDMIDVDAARLNAHLAVIESNAFDFVQLDNFGTELGKIVLPDLVRDALLGSRHRRLVVIHDARSSRVPWETVKIDEWFPAAEAGLTRKYEAEDLAVAKWLEERRLVRELSVLLIVNPTQDLPGAEREGERIKEIFAQDQAVRLEELWREQATFSAVRAAFRSGKYDVVHYAGHAFFDPVNRARSGVLCHGGQVLSGIELASLEKLPAVVFFNACEAARVRSVKERKSGSATAKRLETNVGLAEAFLRAGIGNYIGTYWPVGDYPAKVFAETFYRDLIGGKPLGAALNAGRNVLLKEQSVDWADYVHYGSPSFVVKQRRP